MNTKIASWFLKSDEAFLKILKNEQERTKNLHRLYALRPLNFFVMIFILAAMVIFRIWSPGGLDPELLFLFVCGILLYIELDTKIKMIKLYELLSAADKKEDQLS